MADTSRELIHAGGGGEQQYGAIAVHYGHGGWVDGFSMGLACGGWTVLRRL